MSALWLQAYGSVVASRGSDLKIVDFAVVGGFEGSPGAEDALAFGGAAGVWQRARLLVTCVYVVPPGGGDDER